MLNVNTELMGILTLFTEAHTKLSTEDKRVIESVGHRVLDYVVDNPNSASNNFTLLSEVLLFLVPWDFILGDWTSTYFEKLVAIQDNLLGEGHGLAIVK